MVNNFITTILYDYESTLYFIKLPPIYRYLKWFCLYAESHNIFLEQSFFHYARNQLNLIVSAVISNLGFMFHHLKYTKYKNRTRGISYEE